jgi:hypothetical protein
MNETDAWKAHNRITWLGFGCFGMFLVVFVVSLLANAGGPPAGPVSAPTSGYVVVVGALLTFLWGLSCLTYFALLTGFQCPRCGGLYFVVNGRPLPFLTKCSKCGLPRPR